MSSESTAAPGTRSPPIQNLFTILHDGLLNAFAALRSFRLRLPLTRLGLEPQQGFLEDRTP
jgi:hypothetical protein